MGGFNRKFNFNDKHVFLPINVWSKGLIGNKKFVKAKFCSSKDPDLIVILNHKPVTDKIIKEFVVLNIPIIIIGFPIKLALKSCYITFASLNLGKKIKEFSSFLLYSVLKKTKKHEKKYI